jgi:PAS domain S-box-containing protein
MRQPLRILSVEDNPVDTQLIKDLLEAEGVVCEITRVDSEAALVAALDRGGLDLILADYTLPSFDGLSALERAIKIRPEVPFIFVTGTLGEEVAIEALKIGATDYVLKTRISRLALSVFRAVREAEQRIERLQSAEQLRRTEAYQAEAQRLSHTGSFGWNVNTGEIYWSDETFRIFELHPETKPSVDLVLRHTHPDDRMKVQQLIERASRERTPFDLEHRLLMTDASVKYVRVVGRPSTRADDSLEFVGAVTDITAEKVAEQRHQGDQRQIRRIIDAMPQLVVVLAPDGKALYENQAFVDYAGFDLAETDGAEFFNRAYHPEDVAKSKQERRDALARGLPFKLELRPLRNNGTYRWHEFLYKPLVGDDGLVLRWYASGTDIHDRKQAEEQIRNENLALREDISKQKLLALAQKAARAMAFDWYIQQETNTWSPEQEALYGLAPGSFDGKYETWKKLVHPDDWPTIVKAVTRAHETGEISAEFRVVWPDGSIHWLASNGQMFMDEDGRPFRMVGFTGDITPRKVAEEALRRSEGYLAEAQRLSHTGSYAWNVAKREIVYWSEETYRLWGFDQRDGIPSFDAFRQRIHPDDLPLAAEALNRTVLNKERNDVLLRTVLPDGTLRYIQSVGHPVLNESGDVVEVVGTNVDITERKRSEEELLRSERYLAEAQRLTHSGSWAWDVRTGDLFWSEETYRVFGFEPGEIKPTTAVFYERVHPEDLPLLQERAQLEATQKGRIDSGGDFRVILPDGKIRYIHSGAHPVTDESGEIVEVVGTAVDVTEQQEAKMALENAFEQIKALKDQLYNENIALREEIDRSSMFEEIVGESPALQAVLAHVVKVAPTDSTVLITGETGTGKELIARAIHKRSHRAARAFVSVNCAAIPPSLIASELFGHEKGAFTGAMQRRLGRFELAEGGTIFLDEIGELPPDVQIALLRVVQEREFERVGGEKVLRADVRVIAATNRDLQAAIDAGSFRSDLYYRLNVFPIIMPPLRRRKEDIPLLVEYFISRFATKAGKKIRGINKATLERLIAYSWPGNIRELQNVIERSLIVSDSENFTVDESWLSTRLEEVNSFDRSPFRLSASQEKTAIEAALAEAQGRISGPDGAAAKLGIPASTLDSKIKALKINKHKFKAV